MRRRSHGYKSYWGVLRNKYLTENVEFNDLPDIYIYTQIESLYNVLSNKMVTYITFHNLGYTYNPSSQGFQEFTSAVKVCCK